MTPIVGLLLTLEPIIVLIFAVVFILGGLRQRAIGNYTASGILLGGGLLLILLFMVFALR